MARANVRQDRRSLGDTTSPGSTNHIASSIIYIRRRVPQLAAPNTSPEIVPYSIFPLPFPKGQGTKTAVSFVYFLQAGSAPHFFSALFSRGGTPEA